MNAYKSVADSTRSSKLASFNCTKYSKQTVKDSYNTIITMNDISQNTGSSRLSNEWQVLKRNKYQNNRSFTIDLYPPQTRKSIFTKNGQLDGNSKARIMKFVNALQRNDLRSRTSSGVNYLLSNEKGESCIKLKATAGSVVDHSKQTDAYRRMYYNKVKHSQTRGLPPLDPSSAQLKNSTPKVSILCDPL
ncbi:hypothetical protein GJ496_001477 [Pomphorhynchus laevis]|nr:hypothetical protein GJ496_001477 [Pomphorhynchus laevis]